MPRKPQPEKYGHPKLTIRVDSDAQEAILAEAKRLRKAHPDRELNVSQIVRALLTRNKDR